jgi:anti-sigma factor RsiW
MTCTEFQQILPDLLEGQASSEPTAHLQSCHACAELVADLRAICDEARQLGPVAEPSPRIWANIQRTLEAEGLVHAPLQPLGVLSPARGRWSPFTWLAPVTAVLALAVGVFVYNSYQSKHSLVGQLTSVASSQSQSPNTVADLDDEQLLAQVAPPMRAAYADNLKSVNAFIRDAEQDLQQNPDDEEARHFLMDAYEQKETLYDLAMNRSMP